jgi:hypothetical protein
MRSSAVPIHGGEEIHLQRLVRACEKIDRGDIRIFVRGRSRVCVRRFCICSISRTTLRIGNSAVLLIMSDKPRACVGRHPTSRGGRWGSKIGYKIKVCVVRLLACRVQHAALCSGRLQAYNQSSHGDLSPQIPVGTSLSTSQIKSGMSHNLITHSISRGGCS